MHLTCTISVDWVCCAELKLRSQGSFAVVWSDGGGGLMVWFGGRVWRWSGVEFGRGGLSWGGVTDGLVWWSYVWSGRTDRINGLICRRVCHGGGLVCRSLDDLIWKIKWRSPEVRKEITQLSASGKLRKEKWTKCGNTFIGAVATLKTTATTKPNYISNYRILLRIFPILSIWLSVPL